MTMATDQSLPKKIAVLMGGPWFERDVSLATARGVSKALRSLGAEVVEVDVQIGRASCRERVCLYV